MQLPPNPLHQVSSEQHCLAKAIYFETFQSSEEESRRAVGWAVFNRKSTPGFPFTICEGIKDQGYPWRHVTYLPDTKYYTLALRTAFNVLNNDFDDPTNGAIYFASHNDGWFNSMIRKGFLIPTLKVGGHTFYTTKDRAHNDKNT